MRALDARLRREMGAPEVSFFLASRGASETAAAGTFSGYNQESMMEKEAATRSETVVKSEKVGRNDPCPCNSGKKYKKCHGRFA